MQRCYHTHTRALCRVLGGASGTVRGLATIPPIERISSRPSARLSDVYMNTGPSPAEEDTNNNNDADDSDHRKKATPFTFAVKDTERGLFEHGVSPDARTFIAEAEAQYRASSAMLHQTPSMALPETELRLDPLTGTTATVTRIAAPTGDTYVPSSKARFAMRGHVGELEQQRHAPHHDIPDEHAQLSLKKERQLGELLASPMPLLSKAQEVQWLLAESYEQKLPLRPDTTEAIMQLFAHASLQSRLSGRRPDEDVPALGPSATAKEARSVATGGLASMDEVPFLAEMRRLYAHQKVSFTAPTPHTLELLMTTVSAVSSANKSAFHLANRLFLDADKYVVLPTRTMYTAFFLICQVNDAMPIAVARFADAVTELQIPPNAPMVTALLKGLNESGYAEEALALLSRTRQVPLSTPLLNASLEALLLSQQPLACFSVMEAVQAAAVELSPETYTLLLLACEQSGDWTRVTAILADMQARRVKGNTQTLNLLLKGLLKEKLGSYARQLHNTMRAKQVEVWPALEEGLTRLQPPTPPRKR